MLHVGIDDTDSLDGGCTTWVALRVIEELLPDFDLIGPPRLVRLNPDVPWKTRGNGAVALAFGRGAGEQMQVGELPNGPVFAHAEAAPVALDAEALLERVLAIVRAEARPSAQPGVIVSETRPPEGLYWQGVRGIVRDTQLREALEGSAHAGLNGGRGLAGAACALAWSPRSGGVALRCTWELLGYRERDRWGTPRKISAESVAAVAAVEKTFGCRDPDGSPAMVPHSPCPVLWGLRGLEPAPLTVGFVALGPEQPERWLLWQTNQATDDHYATALPAEGGASVRLSGTVAAAAQSRRGGHRFFGFAHEGGELECAAFEPSGDFRHVVDMLVPDDELEVCGSFEAGVLKLEKLRVIALAPRQHKPPNPNAARAPIRPAATRATAAALAAPSWRHRRQNRSRPRSRRAGMTRPRRRGGTWCGRRG